ncbi:zinc metalloprotease, Peptidase family M48, putative [Rhodospirillum centenum SW]|uniref:Zinc metalloprotease, Peptidase family M48, putative n=2 Tax=Rhodospirillum centenum TaxID=34018 RepID=B6IPB2_RHOCS|nr:zinc metalloprotease, Peptidase family M48, putative [Rhodospirillum centenum SW]
MPAATPAATSAAATVAGTAGKRRAGRARIAGLLTALLLLAGCAVNPATGQRQFTGLLSPDQERQLGAEQHPQILAEMGGAYEDTSVQAYVEGLGQRLAASTGLPGTRYTFTVLDSEVVNAFALPGGYVYVTRGLMALANNEAQLAGVLGHEIGHVTARHTAERYSQGTLAQVGAVLAGALGGQQLGQAAAAGAQLVMAGWSRDQELEADGLGIRYMAATGYDPLEMAAFLDAMGAHARLEATLAGRPGAADSFSYLQTHPPTGQRVERATEAAGSRPPAGWTTDRDAYLRRIDGIVYGDSPKNGVVRGRVFLHPALGFRFEVPEGFRLLNGQTQVTAVGPDQRSLITFDGAPAQGAPDPAAYLTGVWAPRVPLSGLESLSIDGRPAATAVARADTDAGPVDVRFVALRFDPRTYYRFLFVSAPDATARLSADYRRTAYSFRALGADERAQIRPRRLRVVTVAPGQTVADFVRRMPDIDHAEERFRVLNNLPAGAPLQPGQLVKIVTEG